jgi:hypothetical protein
VASLEVLAGRMVSERKGIREEIPQKSRHCYSIRRVEK